MAIKAMKLMDIGTSALKLHQLHHSVRMPSAVGLNAAFCLEEFCNADIYRYNVIRNKSKFNKNHIKTVCDIGTGAGHLAILCANLFAKTVNQITGVDISEKAVQTAEYNWHLNQMDDGKVAFNTMVCDVEEVFDHFMCVNQKFDLIVCNPPNMGMDSGSKNKFNVTNDDGRYVLDAVLSKGFECLNDGGYIYTTDTTLNCSYKTDDYLENALDLTKDSDWFEIKRIKLNVPFLDEHGDKLRIHGQWLKRMIDTNRIMVNGDDKSYYEMRRYLLIRKPMQH